MTGNLMAEWAENGFIWDERKTIYNPSGMSRLNKLMEQACNEWNNEYISRYPDEKFRMHPFDIKMECNGVCWSDNGTNRSDLVGNYTEIRGQAVYFCNHNNCKARAVRNG